MVLNARNWGINLTWFNLILFHDSQKARLAAHDGGGVGFLTAICFLFVACYSAIAKTLHECLCGERKLGNRFLLPPRIGGGKEQCARPIPAAAFLLLAFEQAGCLSKTFRFRQLNENAPYSMEGYREREEKQAPFPLVCVAASIPSVM